MAREEERQDQPNGQTGQELVPARAGQHLPSTEVREPVPQQIEEVHLRDYLDVILRRKWLVMGFLLLTFVSTAIFTLTAVKIYKARATIEINPKTPKVTKFEEVVAAEVQNQQLIQTHADLLRSDSMAKRVVEELDLPERLERVQEQLGRNKGPGLVAQAKTAVIGWVKSFLPQKEEQVLRQPILSEEAGKERGAIGFVKGNLSVSPRRNSMLMDITFTSPDRRLSQDVANTLTEEFVEWEMDKKLKASERAREFLMKQIDRARIELEKAEEDLNRFAKQSGIVSLDSKLNSVYRELEEYNTALAHAEAHLINKRTLYEQAREDKASELPQVLSNTMIATLKGEYAKVYAEYAKQSVTFHDAYPAVKALKTRMESIELQVRAEEQKIRQALRNEYEGALRRVEALRKKADQQKRTAMDLNERATQYKIMDRQVETNKAIYQSLLERSKEIESMVGISASNIHIVDPAFLPIFPFKPKVLRNLLLAIVVGLMGGIGLAFFVEYFADTITNPEEITERFRIPILGVAPLMKTQEYPIEMTLMRDPRAAMSEALRTAKVSIQLSRADTHAKSFLVTSTIQGEGKTTLASNMAQAFAQSEERVLLVDADLRKPRIHKIFREHVDINGHGLTHLLAGMVEEPPVCRTEIANLDILPAGPIPPNPVELLASQRFGKLMHTLEERYDRIVIDAPPNQGFADVLVLSRHVGGVVLVTILGETTRDAVRHFKRSMLNVDGNILGCIINKVNFGKRYGYRYYNRYYRHYYNYEYYGEGNGKKGRKKLKKEAGPPAAAQDA